MNDVGRSFSDWSAEYSASELDAKVRYFAIVVATRERARRELGTIRTMTRDKYVRLLTPRLREFVGAIGPDLCGTAAIPTRAFPEAFT